MAIASTSSSKGSKNLKLALDLTRATSEQWSPKYSATLQFTSSVSSLSNTPALEPDWTDEHDALDNEDDDEAQYVYIAADSPFYRAPSTPRTSSYLSVSGFPFACDALAEEDPLFAPSCSTFDDEFDAVPRDNTVIVIVDAGFVDNNDSQINNEWKFTEVFDQVKPTRLDVDNE
ncbi:hypothetical protein DXG01_010768 [Tephrocybe rancida]|nr:hypothetical protein DXG01_010768 [Tephrocybe rancida]